jgi:PKHD-type hydroxylase
MIYGTNMTRLTSNPQMLWKCTQPFVYWDNFFSESDLQNIELYCKSVGTENAKIASSESGEVNESIRNSEVKLHYVNQDNEWLFDKLLTVAGLVNDNFYRFDLLGFDHFQYTEYNGAGTKYDYHTDMLFGNNIPHGMELCRKLSFSLILSEASEFEGGDFEINNGGEPKILPKQRGDLLAFPSYMLHRVTPVTTGTRYSLVGWINGKPFK